MRRSVIQLAKNTLVITLPNKWVKRLGIKKQDEVEVEEVKNSIIISTSNQVQTSEKALYAKGSKRFISRLISIPYRQGCNKIELKYDNPKAIKDIQDNLNICLGYEIISRGQNHCVIRDVANLGAEDFNALFSRFFFLTLSIGKDILGILETKNYDELKDMKQLFDTQNKLHLACTILINKDWHKLDAHPMFTYLLIDILERAGDQFHGMIDFLLSQDNVKLSKETLIYYKSSMSCFEKTHSLFNKFNFDDARSLYDTNTDLNKEGDKLILASTGQNTIALHYLLNLNRNLKEAGSAIMGLSI